MAVYPGNPGVRFKPMARPVPGVSRVTQISLGSHTGTHIDAPSHIADSGAGASNYPLELMNGRCDVVEINVASVIEAGDLPLTWQPRVLIKTKNSAGALNEFNPNFVALNESAAHELVKRNVLLVGIDGPSIKKKGVKDLVHKILLDAGIIILEGLWLNNVEVGEYELFCLPLSVDLDGAPVRAALRESTPKTRSNAERPDKPWTQQ